MAFVNDPSPVPGYPAQGLSGGQPGVVNPLVAAQESGPAPVNVGAVAAGHAAPVFPGEPDPRDALLAFLLHHVHGQALQGVHPLEALSAAIAAAHQVVPHPVRLPAAPHFGRLPVAHIASLY